jgi:hypothetical protein
MTQKPASRACFVARQLETDKKPRADEYIEAGSLVSFPCKVKVKLSLCVSKHHATNTYGEMEIQFHALWPRPLYPGILWVGPGAGLKLPQPIAQSL